MRCLRATTDITTELATIEIDPKEPRSELSNGALSLVPCPGNNMTNDMSDDMVNPKKT
jgi:hypothetical protein